MPDKNQVKVDRAILLAEKQILDWLDKKPTGLKRFTFEVHSNQGGVRQIFIEQQEREVV